MAGRAASWPFDGVFFPRAGPVRSPGRAVPTFFSGAWPTGFPGQQKKIPHFLQDLRQKMRDLFLGISRKIHPIPGKRPHAPLSGERGTHVACMSGAREARRAGHSATSIASALAPKPGQFQERHFLQSPLQKMVFFNFDIFARNYCTTNASFQDRSCQ
jgi:hypothetical protein